MNIILFYFSGTGNTRWVSNQLKEILAVKSVNIDLYPINSEMMGTLINLNLNRYDKIGIAHPIYGANLPPIVDTFINMLESKLEETTEGFIISTFGFINALGYFAEIKHFKYLKIRQYINTRMPNNITTPKLKAPIPDKKSADLMKNRTLNILKRSSKYIMKKRLLIMGIAPYLIPGIIIRKISKEHIHDSYKQLSVSTERCIKCFDCVNNCPTKAISITGSKFTFSSKCTACMRCYNYCPKNAILINRIYADPKEYPRYKL